MLDLVHQSDFQSQTPTVLSVDFAKRFGELFEAVKAAGGSRGNSLELRKKLAEEQAWIVATISPDLQKTLQTQSALVRLSEDTMVKMFAHHGELGDELLTIFRDTSLLLKNAIKIEQKDDFNVVYFAVGNRNYMASVKATQDRKELYLTTIYALDDERFKKALKSH